MGLFGSGYRQWLARQAQAAGWTGSDGPTPAGGGTPVLQRVQGPPRCVQSYRNADLLDYSKMIYKKGTQSTRDHIISRHLSGLPGASQYTTSGGFNAVRRTNRHTYVRGVQRYNPTRGSVEFDLTVPGAPYLITGRDPNGNPTYSNRLVVAPDCRTVITSYPR